MKELETTTLPIQGVKGDGKKPPSFMPAVMLHMTCIMRIFRNLMIIFLYFLLQVVLFYHEKDICDKAESLKKCLHLESQNLTDQDLSKNKIDRDKQLEIEIEYEVLSFKCEKLQIKCQEDKEGPKTAKDRFEKTGNQKDDTWADNPGFPQ